MISVDWSRPTRLVSGGSDGTARVWSIEGAVRRGDLRLSAQQTRSGTFAAFSPDGDQVMTGDAGIQAVKIWDVSRLGGEEVVNLETDQLAPVDVAYAPDGHIVAPIPDRSSLCGPTAATACRRSDQARAHRPRW